MKFTNYLSCIENASQYPMFSLMVFFAFFIILIFFVVRMKKSTISMLKHLPLQDDMPVGEKDLSKPLNDQQ